MVMAMRLPRKNLAAETADTAAGSSAIEIAQTALRFLALEIRRFGVVNACVQ
jgi:hypothetical protein